MRRLSQDPPYRNLGRDSPRRSHARRSLSDSADPCTLVQCSLCARIVMAFRGAYFDAPEVKHEHQPAGVKLPRQPYGIREG